MSDPEAGKPWGRKHADDYAVVLVCARDAILSNQRPFRIQCNATNR